MKKIINCAVAFSVPIWYYELVITNYLKLTMETGKGKARNILEV